MRRWIGNAELSFGCQQGVDSSVQRSIQQASGGSFIGGSVLGARGQRLG